MEKIGKYIIWVFLILYGALLIFKVVSHPTPFFDWDESIYMQVGKEMIQHHSLIPLYQGQPWLEKPPLAPLLYGVVSTLAGNPEVTTRLFSVLLSLVALGLLHMWILRISKNSFFALSVTAFTAFNPIFYQRAEIVNTDVFLLIGWLGYFLFYENFWLGTFFLTLGVLTKSLLGFYPAVIMLGYEIYLFFLKKDAEKLTASVKKIGIQSGILILWYIVMLIKFGALFIQVHFEDHLLKRVTESIESHFGHRTFYLDIIVQEYGWFSIIPLFSLGYLTVQFLKKNLNLLSYILSVALVPWFMFLNLTKTKIDWYIYPAVPQITFLLLFPLLLLQKFRPLFYIATTLIVSLYIFVNYSPLYSAHYSSYDDNYKMAIAAKSQCNSLKLLVDGNDRKTHDVLQKLHLLISTSDIYGSHPAMIYYFGKRLIPYYDTGQFNLSLSTTQTNSCIGFEKDDLPLLKNNAQYIKIGTYGQFYLLKKRV